MPTRILIADDHAIFRTGLRVTLERLDAPSIIDEADSVDGLIDLIEAPAETDIAIVIVDLQMPGMEGLAAISDVRRRLRQTPILVLSASEEADDVFRSLAAGASGYIAKSASAEKLVEAIKTVRAGGVSVPRDLLAGTAIANVGTRLPTAASIQRNEFAGRTRLLTPRQIEVLGSLSHGHSNKEIAYLLNMNEGTVKAHISAIMRQLNVRNRVQIVRAAENAGLIQSPSEPDCIPSSLARILRR